MESSLKNMKNRKESQAEKGSQKILGEANLNVD